MDPKVLAEAFEAFKKTNAEALIAINKMLKEQEDGTKESLKKAIETANALAIKVQAQADQLLAMEQKLVQSVITGKAAPKSLGQLVVESDAFKSFCSGQSNKFKLSIPHDMDVLNNTITGQSGSPATNSDVLVPVDRRPGIIPGAFRRLRVKDLLPQGNTSSNACEFTRELVFTNSAAETAEGAQKPESSVTFELYSMPVVTIAHWIKLSKQVLEDAPALASYINTRMAYGVDLREETQLVAGNGSGQNLKGMTVSPNYTAYTPVTGDNALDTANRAKYVLDNADYPANGIIMNPTDWGNIERTKVGSSDDRYVIGDPRSPIGPVLWGLPVAVTPSMTEGKLLIANFDIAFLYMKRKETVVEIFEQDDTNVQKNLVTVRAEKRAALGGLRPASVRYGNLTL